MVNLEYIYWAILFLMVAIFVISEREPFKRRSYYIAIFLMLGGLVYKEAYFVITITLLFTFITEISIIFNTQKIINISKVSQITIKVTALLLFICIITMISISLNSPELRDEIIQIKASTSLNLRTSVSGLILFSVIGFVNLVKVRPWK